MPTLEQPALLPVSHFLAGEGEKDLLRFRTAGSVDDGKSIISSSGLPAGTRESPAKAARVAQAPVRLATKSAGGASRTQLETS